MFRLALGSMILFASIAFAQQESLELTVDENPSQESLISPDVLVGSAQSEEGVVEPVYYRFGSARYGFRDRGYYRRRSTPICRIRPYLSSCRY